MSKYVVYHTSESRIDIVGVKTRDGEYRLRIYVKPFKGFYECKGVTFSEKELLDFVKHERQYIFGMTKHEIDMYGMVTYHIGSHH